MKNMNSIKILVLSAMLFILNYLLASEFPFFAIFTWFIIFNALIIDLMINIKSEERYKSEEFREYSLNIVRKIRSAANFSVKPLTSDEEEAERFQRNSDKSNRYFHLFLALVLIVAGLVDVYSVYNFDQHFTICLVTAAIFFAVDVHLVDHFHRKQWQLPF